MTGSASEPDFPTVEDLLRSWSDHIEQLLTTLVREHGELEDLSVKDRLGGFPILRVHPFRWPPLGEAGRQLQSRVLEEYRAYSELLRVLLRGQPESSAALLAKDIARMVATIGREDSGRSTTAEHLQRAQKALTRHLELVHALYSATEATMIVIPDTNALYWNTALEQWRAPEGRPFILMLTPAVVTEIDKHKYDERNSARRAKAERLARQIGEYRRRGRLADGVPLVRDVSAIRSIATEPRLSESLPWLDAASADDRFLASALEVMRSNTRAFVVVVTRDLNLQNKLEFARLPFVEPVTFIPQAK